MNAPVLYIKNMHIKEVQNGRRLSEDMLENVSSMPEGKSEQLKDLLKGSQL